MPLYFLLLDHAAFHQRLRPALAASWRQRSFEPCRPICAELLPAALAFAERYHTGRDGLLLAQVADGLPEMQTAPDSLGALLAPDRVDQEACPRDRFAPIQQAHYGARDLVFGG